MQQHTHLQMDSKDEKPQIKLNCLGFPSLVKGNQAIEILSHKTLALFAYLCLHRNSKHPREKLAEIFWPARPEQQAQQSLKNAVYELRTALGDQKLSIPYLYVDRSVIGIHSESRHLIQIDSEHFESLVLQALGSSTATAIPLLEQAITLYVGAFMEGFDAEWIEPLRSRYSFLYEEAITTLSDYYSMQGDLQLAVQWRLRVWEVAPFCEETLQHLMQIYAQWGQFNRALALCKNFAKTLHRQLGVELNIETIQLYHAIAARKPCGPLED